MIPVIGLSGAHNGSGLQITSLDWIDLYLTQTTPEINQTPIRHWHYMYKIPHPTPRIGLSLFPVYPKNDTLKFKHGEF